MISKKEANEKEALSESYRDEIRGAYYDVLYDRLGIEASDILLKISYMIDRKPISSKEIGFIKYELGRLAVTIGNIEARRNES